ncbi:Signal recognition particle 9 kDa [Chlorella sorokiniana]|uniref:Signal recognition particle 9 kDa protein n=1 Tax=Chlorella sorokiniana TaxID=3076 RepID=A0A2P6TBS7_CHLSO|nr:Signal recognition particle 9 kDa [Chlorella sorokiniana]|eukprot:PRW18343.1 Signal recognition particle 9 kDa [Chlorella sorokiniana]
MYIENWESFYQQVVALYKAAPLKTRFVTKYRHGDGKLVLKVTDDVTCLQYKTDQQSDLRKLEKLNLQMMALMATGEAPAEDVEMQPAEQQQQQQQQRQKKTRKG